MVSDGFAFAYLKYKFNKSTEYKNAQLDARETNKGIWGDGKKETIINEQKKKETAFWQDLSPKACIVGSLVVILLLIGLYYYIKK
jgi:hypothetical protein